MDCQAAMDCRGRRAKEATLAREDSLATPLTESLVCLDRLDRKETRDGTEFRALRASTGVMATKAMPEHVLRAAQALKETRANADWTESLAQQASEDSRAKEATLASLATMALSALMVSLAWRFFSNLSFRNFRNSF